MYHGPGVSSCTEYRSPGGLDSKGPAYQELSDCTDARSLQNQGNIMVVISDVVTPILHLLVSTLAI